MRTSDSSKVISSRTSGIAFDLETRSSSGELCHSKHSFSSCTRAKQCSNHSRISGIAFDLATRSSGVELCHTKHSFSSCTRAKQCFAHPRSGFTLIEVVVALAIFAVAAMALTKVAMQYTQSTANAILRTKAQFVAQNEIAQMEINGEWLEGTQSKQITAEGETWQIDKRAELTISPKVQKIEIQISLFNTELGKVESGVSNMVFYNHPISNASS